MFFVTGVVLWVVFGALYKLLGISAYTPETLAGQTVHWIIVIALLLGVGFVGLSFLLLAARVMP